MDLKTIVKMGLKMTVDVVDPIILSRLSSYSSVPLPLSTNFSLFSLFSYKSQPFFCTISKTLEVNIYIVKPRPKSQTPKAKPQPSQIHSKSVPKGLGLTLKSYGPPPHHHHPITLRSPVWDHMVQVEAPSTPNHQKGVQNHL